MRKLVDRVAKKIMTGYNLVIYPEGTRVMPGQHPGLKRGLMFLAHELKLPIMPVGVDTGLYWPKHGKMNPGTTHIYFEHELPSSATTDEVSEAINRHSC